MTRSRLALLLCCLMLLGMGRRMPSLEDKSILLLPEPGCVCSDCVTGPWYIVERDEGEGWKKIEWTMDGLDPPACITFARVEVPRFRAGCLGETATGWEYHRIEVGPMVVTHCERIFTLDGREYKSKKVEKWNAAHAGG